MKRLFLMRGIAFSGKTIVAKQLSQALGCAYVSLDDINAERGLMEERVLRSKNGKGRTQSPVRESRS